MRHIPYGNFPFFLPFKTFTLEILSLEIPKTSAQYWIACSRSISSYVLIVIFRSSSLTSIFCRQNINVETSFGSLFIKLSSFLVPSPQYRHARITMKSFSWKGRINCLALLRETSHWRNDLRLLPPHLPRHDFLNLGNTLIPLVYLKIVAPLHPTTTLISGRLWPALLKWSLRPASWSELSS